MKRIVFHILVLTIAVGTLSREVYAQDNAAPVVAPTFAHDYPGHSSTLLTDGRALLMGGQSKDGAVNFISVKDMRRGEVQRLSITLRFARAWHSATVLPDGTILVLGGVGSDNRVVEQAELFDRGAPVEDPVVLRGRREFREL